MGTKRQKDHLGNEFDSFKSMCEHYGHTANLVKNRMRCGWSLEKALTTVNKGRGSVCTDHLGNKFPTKKAMCDHYGIDVTTYNWRTRKLGYSVKKALTDATTTCYKPCKDHLGNEFASKTEMCKHWGIRLDLFDQRIKRGYSLKKALETGVGTTTTSKIWVDHEGNEFSTFKDMCSHWNKYASTVFWRLKKGCSLEESLTAGNAEIVHKPRLRCKDHLGNEYNSRAEMCRHYNINTSTYICRIASGWSLKDALTKDINPKDFAKKTCVDHLGNTYPSIRKKCEHYGITYERYIGRIGSGWSEEDALTKITKSRSMPCTDHLGNKFDSAVEMCRHYGVDFNVFYKRMFIGWSLERALTQPRKKRRRKNNNEAV